jgi:hypothetical protein
LLNDPEVRSKSDYAQLILDHILEHRQLAETTDPVLTAMVRTGKMPEGGIQPQPQMMQQPPREQAPQAGPAMAEPQKTADPAKDLVDREGAA